MMSYYIKPPRADQLLGPYTVADISSQLQSKTITEDYQAHRVTGESSALIRRSDSWIPVVQVFAQPSSPEPDAPQPEKQQMVSNGGLDLKKLAGFVSLLGVLLFGYGAFQRVTNQPLDNPESTTRSNQSIMDALNNSVRDSDARMAVEQKNMERQEIREKSTKFMIAGGIVIFLGFAVSASVKKK